MLTVPILRDRQILARLADGHTLKSIGFMECIDQDSVSMRLNRAAGRAMAPSTYALLAVAVERGWIVRGAGGWIAAPDTDDAQAAGVPC